jgi:membrane protease subunit HflC
VVDALKFYQTVGTVDGANSRLSPFLNSALRAALGEATVIQVVREMREQLMAHVRDQLDREAKQFGIEVVDVRIRRADLPEQNSQAVYKRMQTEREREAQEFRSQGTQKAQEIRARADRDATVTVAEATSKAEQTRGEGDAERNRIFADAFSKDPDFFAFYRSMQAYDAGLLQGDTRFLVRPDSEFFRYFLDPNGKQRTDAGASAATPSTASPPTAAPSAPH